MLFRARISAVDDGMTLSSRGMLTPMEVLSVHTQNVANFGIPGYQRQEPMVTAFAEMLGPNAVERKISTEIGRLLQSGNPLDLALNSQGAFKKLGALGNTTLSRDGRFQLDKDGTLRTLDDQVVLSANNQPIRLPKLPKNLTPQALLKAIKIKPDGTLSLVDPVTGKQTNVATIGVFNEAGLPASQIDIKQGYVENSNVMLQQEFVSMLPLRRQFEANRQLFIMQSDAMSRMIQELGRTQ